MAPTPGGSPRKVVAILAALAVLVPLYGLTRALFDDRIALLAALIYVLLPLPAAIGHDTLSDSLALLGAVLALRLGEVALRTGAWSAWLGCGLVAGLGYLARPEVVVVPGGGRARPWPARWRGSMPVAPGARAGSRRWRSPSW